MNFVFNKVTIRSIFRNKYNWINIIGLTVSISVFMTIFLYIQNELSYEKQHENLNNIYRIEQFRKDGDEFRNMCGAPPPLSLVIAEDIPEIIVSTRKVEISTALIGLPDGSKIDEQDIIFADKSFLEIFTYPVIYGNPDGNLNQPYMAVITEEVAHKYFGSGNAVGKVLKFNNGFDIEVKAVVKKLSDNSHLNFNILISFNTLLSLNGPEVVIEDWHSNWTKHYVLVHQNSSLDAINGKLERYLKKYQGEESENILYLKPLKDIHLKSSVIDETTLVGNTQNVMIFSIIAFLILIVACINYINLTTAYSSVRSKEVGIRKINGANRINLVFTFIGESFVIVLISLILAAILSEFVTPYFNKLINRNIEINYIKNWEYLAVMLSLCILVTIISGVYPAVLLSKFSSTEILKSTYFGGNKKSALRRLLVVFQFFISISLVTSTIFLVKQLNFLTNKDLGYNTDKVIIIHLANPSKQKSDQFRMEVEQNTDIHSVSISDYLPMNSTNWTRFSWEGAQENEYLKMNINYVDPGFTNVYDISIQSGNGFTVEQTDHEQLYVLLNEKAVNEIGWKNDVIGKKIFWAVDYRTRYLKVAIVAGVVSDYHYLSKHYSINPIIMPLFNQEATGSNISIKLNSNNHKESLKFLELNFKKIYDDELWNYRYADNVVQSLYDNESRMGQLVIVLTVVAIIIAIMGLYGLTSFITNQRIKEIGIRKVMGASISSILYIISKDLLIMLLIANIIAWPVAYIQILNWLQNFEYHINIDFYVFALATLFSFILALMTVGIKILKASNKNPVEALRYE